MNIIPLDVTIGELIEGFEDTGFTYKDMLAWSKNIKEANRIFRMSASENSGIKIHPTQKPIKLYRWILQNYAKPNDLILDTHSGSGSLACACHLEKFDFIACELDEDYHRDSVNRLTDLRSQGVLF